MNSFSNGSILSNPPPLTLVKNTFSVPVSFGNLLLISISDFQSTKWERGIMDEIEKRYAYANPIIH